MKNHLPSCPLLPRHHRDLDLTERAPLGGSREIVPMVLLRWSSGQLKLSPQHWGLPCLPKPWPHRATLKVKGAKKNG